MFLDDEGKLSSMRVKAAIAFEDADLLFASWLPCQHREGCDLGHQILDRITADGQTFVDVGSGPYGPVGTKEPYDRLGVEFDEYATEPLPRLRPSVFPRDFIRAYRRKPSRHER